jgi:aconitate hydratase
MVAPDPRLAASFVSLTPASPATEDTTMEGLADALRTLDLSGSSKASYYSLPALEQLGYGAISKLPVSIRIVLESLVRGLDGRRVRDEDVRNLASWTPNGVREHEVPFLVARVLLQDFTGVPLIVDLAAMREAATGLGADARAIEPTIPVDLVVDHSVQVDFHARPDALSLNVDIEFRRNRPRYEFLKWGAQAFSNLRIVPPEIGICHQVNLELLASVAIRRQTDRGLVLGFDTVVGTDSHTTMVNAIGVLGWGVGGIEAEAAMLGQPMGFLTPDVIGVNLHGRLRPGVTATDLVLRITEVLRKAKVVGKFVEFHGEGAASLSPSQRAPISNMAPEYGATVGFFPPDERVMEYLLSTGRDKAQVDATRAFLKAQGVFGIPAAGEITYTQTIDVDLGAIEPCVAGPKRPQDRVPLSILASKFGEALRKPAPDGYGRSEAAIAARHEVDAQAQRTATPIAGGGSQQLDELADAGKRKSISELTDYEMVNNRPTPDKLGRDAIDPTVLGQDVGDGDVLIAAITSCTNTSNPAVMLAAGILAKKAVERGLSVSPKVKTSLAPGSRVVTEYLRRTGLQDALDALGFHLVGYGCTTCIGNSGPLDPAIEKAVKANGVVGVSVLSGNRNFEARVHAAIKANFLASPPLVVAYALAGSVLKDLDREPLGQGKSGPVFLKDVWPTEAEVEALLPTANDPESYQRLYGEEAWVGGKHWQAIAVPSGGRYVFDPSSTYIREPPYFEGVSAAGEVTHVATDLEGARALAIFGDSITTDHISPAGSIEPSSPAGLYLQKLGVPPTEFNSYGARRGNHEVMVRGTFANVRLKNKMVPGVEGGVTVHQPSGERLAIFDAAQRYAAEGTSLVVLAGHEYGTGSSRDWAAKGTRLLGVRAVVARSFERIHRSNLVGMGVLPCEFEGGIGPDDLGLTGDEIFSLRGLSHGLRPRMPAKLVIRRTDGREDSIDVRVRLDTLIEVDHYRHGGVLPYVLRRAVAATAGERTSIAP